MITAVEKVQTEIINELIAERQQLRDAVREMDADLAAALDKVEQLQVRLALEKAGWHCTCGEGS